MRITNFIRILLIALALAGYSAWLQAKKDRAAGNGPETPHNVIPLIRLAEAEALWHEPTTVFVDVRSSTDYEFGHITGAINLPEPEFEQRFPDLKPRLERARVIVVYCKSVDCGASLWATLRLRNEGLMQAKIYPAGWNEWDNHGLPAVKAER
jgi:rhodanese-related sulfurtransferase